MSLARPSTDATEFGISAFVHQKTAVAFHFYKTSNCLPAAEELKAGLYDVKVLDLLRVRP